MTQNPNLRWSRWTGLPALHPAHVWGCCCIRVYFPLTPTNVAWAPENLLGFEQSWEVAKIQVIQSRLLCAVWGTGLESSTSAEFQSSLCPLSPRNTFHPTSPTPKHLLPISSLPPPTPSDPCAGRDQPVRLTRVRPHTSASTPYTGINTAQGVADVPYGTCSTTLGSAEVTCRSIGLHS